MSVRHAPFPDARQEFCMAPAGFPLAGSGFEARAVHKILSEFTAKTDVVHPRAHSPPPAERNLSACCAPWRRVRLKGIPPARRSADQRTRPAKHPAFDSVAALPFSQPPVKESLGMIATEAGVMPQPIECPSSGLVRRWATPTT